MPALVLVVDDDPDIRTMLRLVLVSAGYRLQLAANGLEALGLVQRERPAVVLLDLNMPVMNGWDCFNRLRAQPTRPPVVLITAVQRDQVDALLVGAAGYLPKPFDLDLLLATVQRVIA